jgi:hypothetical protein
MKKSGEKFVKADISNINERIEKCAGLFRIDKKVNTIHIKTAIP